MVNFIMLLFAGLFADGNERQITGGFVIGNEGKYVFYREGKGIGGASWDDIRNVIDNCFADYNAKITKYEGKIIASGTLKLKRHAVIGNFIAGNVIYKFELRQMPKGCQYWFTDLAYQPYVKNRYGQLVKANVKPIPLEENMSKLNQGLWKKQRKYAYQTLEMLSEQIEKQLAKMSGMKTVELP